MSSPMMIVVTGAGLVVLGLLAIVYGVCYRTSKPKRLHADGGRRCLVMHYPDGMRQCVWCSRCRRWIRPERMDEQCEGRSGGRGIGG